MHEMWQAPLAPEDWLRGCSRWWKRRSWKAAQCCQGFLSARNESLEWWLIATVCSSLSLQVGKIKVGESQLLFLSLRFGAECSLAWLSVIMLNPEQRTTWLSTPCWFFSKYSFLFCSTWAKPYQSHPAGSSPKFLSVLSYLFILAFLETLLYGRSFCDGSFCQSPYNQRSDIAIG